MENEAVIMTEEGSKRLRQVAKKCPKYGQRVQNSVFECQMDAAKCRQVKNILENLIDKDVDSLRFYYLGEKYKNKVFDVTETLLFIVREVCIQKNLGTFAPKKQGNLSPKTMEILKMRGKFSRNM